MLNGNNNNNGNKEHHTEQIISGIDRERKIARVHTNNNTIKSAVYVYSF